MLVKIKTFVHWFLKIFKSYSVIVTKDSTEDDAFKINMGEL